MPVELICEFCESEYSVKPSRKEVSRFCCADCRSKWLSENRTGEDHPSWSRKTIKCETCSEEFTKTKEKVERSENHFCCDDCRKEWWSGYCEDMDYSGSEHHNWSGGVVKVDCSYCCGVVEVHTNRNNAQENVFCSQECYGRWLSENITGENHPRYKEGSTGQINYRGSWNKASEKARLRDDGCVYCGISVEQHKDKYGFKPPVHHKKRYRDFEDPYEANKLENLVTLCCEHHRKVEEGKIEAEEL